MFARASQSPPCQAPRQPTVLVSGQRAGVTLSMVALQDAHPVPVLGKTEKCWSHAEIVRQISALLLLLSLTGLIYSWLFNNIRLHLKISLSYNVKIILMKAPGTWRLNLKKESISKNLVEIKLLIFFSKCNWSKEQKKQSDYEVQWQK